MTTTGQIASGIGCPLRMCFGCAGIGFLRLECECSAAVILWPAILPMVEFLGEAGGDTVAGGCCIFGAAGVMEPGMAMLAVKIPISSMPSMPSCPFFSPWA